MTEQQAEQIIKLIENFEKADVICAVSVTGLIIATLLLAIWEIYRLKQLKKMHKEYLATLTEEQVKELERNKRYL